MDGSIRRTSISLPEELLLEGQRLAKLRRRNFSNYIAGLIAADSEKSRSALFFPPPCSRTGTPANRLGDQIGGDKIGDN